MTSLDSVYLIAAKNRFYADSEYFQAPEELERILIVKIAETGKEQLKKRRKAGLSSFYAKGGKIIEILPNNSEQERQSVKSNWISVGREKRSFKLE